MATRPPTKKQREAAAARLKREMDAVQKASTHVEEAANLLRPLEGTLSVADMRGGWLDDVAALGKLYGTLRAQRDAVLAGKDCTDTRDMT